MSNNKMSLIVEGLQQSRINESIEGISGDSSDIAVYEEQVNEKTIKGKETGRYATEKHVGAVERFDLWTAEDLNTGNKVLLIVDKDNPKVHIPVDVASASELPALVKKATKFFSLEGVTNDK